jgi:hypothetical protein
VGERGGKMCMVSVQLEYSRDARVLNVRVLYKLLIIAIEYWRVLERTPAQPVLYFLLGTKHLTPISTKSTEEYSRVFQVPGERRVLTVLPPVRGELLL